MSEPSPEIIEGSAVDITPKPANLPKPAISVGNRGLVAGDFDQMYRMATALASSGMVPDHFKGKPAAALAAIQAGAEVGLAPMTALQWICVINNRPSLWGNAPKALVQSSGLVEDWNEAWDDATKTATCTIKRKGQPSPIVRTFSMADAKQAGLDRKTGPWMTAPARMCANRARARALNDGFADVLLGLQIVDDAPVERKIVKAEDDELLADIAPKENQ